MGKNPKFGVHVWFGSLVIRDQFCSGSEYLKKIWFIFGLSSVNVGFGFFTIINGKMFPWWLLRTSLAFTVKCIYNFIQ